MLLLSTGAPEEERAKILADVESGILASGGLIERRDDWGTQAADVPHRPSARRRVSPASVSRTDVAAREPQSHAADHRWRVALSDHQGDAGNAAAPILAAAGDRSGLGRWADLRVARLRIARPATAPPLAPARDSSPVTSTARCCVLTARSTSALCLRSRMSRRRARCSCSAPLGRLAGWRRSVRHRSARRRDLRQRRGRLGPRDRVRARGVPARAAGRDRHRRVARRGGPRRGMGRRAHQRLRARARVRAALAGPGRHRRRSRRRR